MSGENRFPEELLLNEPDRGHRLIREFYQHYADITKTPNYYTEIGPRTKRSRQPSIVAGWRETATISEVWAWMWDAAAESSLEWWD